MDGYTTKLVNEPIWGCEAAPERLGRSVTQRGHKLVPVVFMPTRLPCSFYVIIPKGFVGLVTRHGRFVGVWHAGYHSAAPWMCVSHLVPQQYTVYDIPVKECPTQDNVMVTIDVTLVFKIMTEDEQMVEAFCYKLGPLKLDEMLRAFQEEAIRGMVRKRKYNEIYDLMDMDHDKQLVGTKRELNNYFNQYGVQITSIAVTNVHLPNEFAHNMQEELLWATRDEFNKLDQKFQLQKIQIKEVEAKAKQKADEDLAKFTAEKDNEVAEERKKHTLVKAETSKIIAEVTEQEKADVMTVKAKANLVVAQINSERDIRLSKIRQQGQAESEKIKVESTTYVALKQADAEAKIAENEAQCMALRAEAEMEATKGLAAKRRYEQKMRALQQLRALSNNDNVCIAGNHGDNMVAQMAANSQQSAMIGINAKREA